MSVLIHSMHMFDRVVFHDTCTCVQGTEPQAAMEVKLSSTNWSACKTLQDITASQGSLVNPVHVWMAEHVKLLK